MCEGIIIDRTPKERINPPPQIGDVWRIEYIDKTVYHYLILDISEGPDYRTATVMIFEDNNTIEDYLDTYCMMEEDCWQKVA